MIKEKQKAATPVATGITAEQQISPTSVYQANCSQSTSNRQERVTQRLRDIPKIYRRIYQQAVKGKSRKAAQVVTAYEAQRRRSHRKRETTIGASNDNLK